MCFVVFPSFNNNREFKYFWLLDLYQEDVKNAAIFSFSRGLSSSQSNTHSVSELNSESRKCKNYKALGVEAPG